MAKRRAGSATRARRAGLFGPLVDVLNATISTETRRNPFQRDPAFIAQLRPLIKAINFYFGTTVRGWQHVPRRGPFLIVGNHSGGAEPNDFWFLLDAWIEQRGVDAPLYGLGYDLLFGMPVVGPMLRRIGVVPASHANAKRALARDAAVVVFPGGDYEVFRPWTERNRIEFGGRTGFIELALTAGVPVVPMTIHGAHQSTLALTRGRRIARWTGIDRLDVNVFPFIWNIPFGLTPAFIPSVQLPAKVTVQFGKPLDWSHYGAAAARDSAVLKRCYGEITRSMQRTLDALARQHPYPVISRIAELTPRALGDRLAGVFSSPGRRGRRNT